MTRKPVAAEVGAAEVGAAEGPTLEWTVDLGRGQPFKRWIVVASAVAAGAFGLAVYQSPVLAVFGVAAVLGSTWEVLLPKRFRLDPRGASARIAFSETAIGWERVRTVREDASGVKLSPFTGDHRLEPFRGVYLRFDGNRDRVLATIAQLWSEDGPSLGRGTDAGRGEDAHRADRRTDRASEPAGAGDPGPGDA